MMCTNYHHPLSTIQPAAALTNPVCLWDFLRNELELEKGARAGPRAVCSCVYYTILTPKPTMFWPLCLAMVIILIFNFLDDDMYYLTCSQVHPSTTACCDVIAGFSLPVCTMLMQLMIDMVLFSIEVTILIVKMSKLDIKPHAVKYHRIVIGTDSQKFAASVRCSE